MRRGFTRRRFLALSAGAAGGGMAAGSIGLRPAIAQTWSLTDRERAVLDAALARMIPSGGVGDWSAAEVGAGEYIAKLLSGDQIYAGGPYRAHFARWRRLSRVKAIGWSAEIDRLRALYKDGLAQLDDIAGGDFVESIPAQQDVILMSLDSSGSPFFAALYDHTMEGVYAHPVYGGNLDYKSWRDLCYEGDVHGVRFPITGSFGAWNLYGGYAPEEISEPGEC